MSATSTTRSTDIAGDTLRSGHDIPPEQRANDAPLDAFLRLFTYLTMAAALTTACRQAPASWSGHQLPSGVHGRGPDPARASAHLDQLALKGGLVLDE